MAVRSTLSLSPRAAARRRVALLTRACALGGVSLALLAPSAHAQTERTVPADRVARQTARAARQAARLAAPVRQVRPGEDIARGGGVPATFRFAPAQANPFALGALGNDPFPTFADFDRDGDLDLLYGVDSGSAETIPNRGGFGYRPNTAGPGATPAFGPLQANPFGLPTTDLGFYNAPVVADMDGDGDLDVLSGMGYIFASENPGGFLYYENTAAAGATTPAFAAPVENPFGLTNPGYAAVPAVADFDGDGDMDVLAGSQDGSFDYFRNTAGPQATPLFAAPEVNPFGLATIVTVEDPFNYSAPAAADLDGDGDTDLLVGSADGGVLFYENTAGPRTAPAFAAPVTSPNGTSDLGGYSRLAIADVNGDSDLDIVGAVRNDDTQIFLFENTTVRAGGADGEVVNPYGLTSVGGGGTNVGGSVSAPALLDIDGDGDTDLLSGRTDGGFSLFTNTAAPGAVPAFAAALPPSALTGVGGISRPAAGDVDGDGDTDLVVGASDGTLRVSVNTAAPGAAPTFAAYTVPAGLTDIGDTASPAVGDLDGDGDGDLLVGANDGLLSYFQNTAAPGAPPAFAAAVANPFGLGYSGDQSAPALRDLDGDGDLDLLVGTKFGETRYFRNDAAPGAAPAFVFTPTSPLGRLPFGSPGVPTVGDLDSDGDDDVVQGSSSGGFQVIENTSPGTLTARMTGTTGWRMLASPSRLTPFDDVLGSDVFTQGIPDADSPNGQPNVLVYTEGLQGPAANGYVAPDALDRPLQRGTGAFVYVFEDANPGTPTVDVGFPKTLRATGRPDFNEFRWSTVFPSNGSAGYITYVDSSSPPADDGWNLLGNPFGSWFDWDAVNLVGINAPVYVYDNATANYLSHSRGVPNAGSLPGGVVGPFQAFWVQANAASPTLTARPGTSNGGPLYRGAAPTVVGLRLRPGAGSALPEGVQSEAFLALGIDGARDGVSALDAFALTPPAQSYVLLATQAAGTDGDPTGLAIDARPAQTAALTVELDVAQVVAGAAAGGALVLDWPGLALPAGWSVRLLDRQTGARVDLSQVTEYPFTLDGPDAAAGVPAEALAIPAITTAPRVAAAGLTSGRFALVVTPDGATAGEGDAAQTLALSAARPNPTTGAASLVLSLPEAAAVEVGVYDVLGRRVAVLAEGTLGAGEHALRVAPGALAAGTYVVRASVGQQTLTQRLTVTR